MNRCPQCEFIYEDDQSTCDMDGMLLVFDSQSLPNVQNLTMSQPVGPLGFQWRRRALPAVAAVILATVLLLVYNVSLKRHAVRNTTDAPPTVSGASTSAANSLAPSEPASDQGVTKETPPPIDEVNGGNKAATRNEGTESTKPPATKPVSEPSTSAPTNVKAKPKTARASQTSAQTTPSGNRKQESKVGSVLKKTGRLLTKPFRLIVRD